MLRKATVVAAVRGGLLTTQEASERYKLSIDELLSWQHSIEKHGIRGLRVSHTDAYRRLEGDSHG
jgi:transposase